MFNPSLPQQAPAANLALPAGQTQLAPLVSHAFESERCTNIDEAIKVHQTAKGIVEKASKHEGLPLLSQRLYEKQAEIHQERITHLDKTKHEGGTRTLVSGNRAHASPTHNGPLSSVGTSSNVDCYTLTASSDLLNDGLGGRVYFFRLTDPSLPELTLYILQGMWEQDGSKLEVILRRPDEMYLPDGIVHTSLLVQSPDEPFKLQMRRRGERDDQAVWERAPSTKGKKNDPSPGRSFAFEGRWFIWKTPEEKSGLFKKKEKTSGLETVYETQEEGGAVVGDKLVWGNVSKGDKDTPTWTLYSNEGLSKEMREHCFSSQVARLMMERFPADGKFRKSQKGVVVDSAINLADLVTKLW